MPQRIHSQKKRKIIFQQTVVINVTLGGKFMHEQLMSLSKNLIDNFICPFHA